MIVSISRVIVLLFAIIISILSLWGIVAPDRLTKLVKGVIAQHWGMYFAVIVRLVFGAALIFAAPVSKLPTVLAVLGWITLVAAVVLPFVGRTRIAGLIAWLERLSPTIVRLWLLFGIAFGGLMIYALI